MVEPLRHRQTKEAETDMFDLKPPRHTSTLPGSTKLEVSITSPLLGAKQPPVANVPRSSSGVWVSSPPASPPELQGSRREALDEGPLAGPPARLRGWPRRWLSTPIWTKDISLVEPAITTKTCRFASSSGAGASLLMARCRSTFRDWVAERTNHPREVAEVALAHIVANATEDPRVRTH